MFKPPHTETFRFWSPFGPTALMQNAAVRGHNPFLAKASTKHNPPPRKDLVFTQPVLGRPVSVRIDAGIPVHTQKFIKAKIQRATALINLAASKLTEQQKRIIRLLRAIVIVPASLPNGAPTQTRTGIDVYSGVFTLLDTYMTAPGATPAFFASDLAHDSFHIWQHQHGEDNTRQNAPKLEREADDFQIAAGRFFGLTQAEIEYLKKDTHTGYNTGRY